MKRTLLNSDSLLVLAAASFALCGSVKADFVDSRNLYLVGSNPDGNALDIAGNNIGGSSILTWTHNYLGLPGDSAFLTITAEGIDGPIPSEDDEVFFNGTSLGFLTQQGFYDSGFNLAAPGPGFIPGHTAISVSTFDVTGLLVSGLNTVTVNVDPDNWINEIETSTLRVFSTPDAGSTFFLLSSALGFLGVLTHRSKRA